MVYWREIYQGHDLRENYILCVYDHSVRYKWNIIVSISCSVCCISGFIFCTVVSWISCRRCNSSMTSFLFLYLERSVDRGVRRWRPLMSRTRERITESHPLLPYLFLPFMRPSIKWFNVSPWVLWPVSTMALVNGNCVKRTLIAAPWSLNLIALLSWSALIGK